MKTSSSFSFHSLFFSKMLTLVTILACLCKLNIKMFSSKFQICIAPPK